MSNIGGAVPSTTMASPTTTLLAATTQTNQQPDNEEHFVFKDGTAEKDVVDIMKTVPKTDDISSGNRLEARKGYAQITITRTTTWYKTVTTSCTQTTPTPTLPSPSTSLVPLPKQTTLSPQAKAKLTPEMEESMKSTPTSDVVKLDKRRNTRTVTRETTWYADLLVPASNCPGQGTSTGNAVPKPSSGGAGKGTNILGIINI